MMRRLAAIPLAFSGAVFAAGSAGKTIVIPSNQGPAYDRWHYAPAVRVGDMVLVSGIAAARGDTYEEKIRFMFDRLKSTLQAAGADLADVVEITSFHRDAKDTAALSEEIKRYQAVKDEYFKGAYPASTVVGTTALLAEGAPVEIRAVAVVGAGKRVTVQRMP